MNTGDWSGFSVNDIVHFLDSEWISTPIVPEQGVTVFNKELQQYIMFDGIQWITLTGTPVTPWEPSHTIVVTPRSPNTISGEYTEIAASGTAPTGTTFGDVIIEVNTSPVTEIYNETVNANTYTLTPNWTGNISKPDDESSLILTISSENQDTGIVHIETMLLEWEEVLYFGYLDAIDNDDITAAEMKTLNTFDIRNVDTSELRLTFTGRTPTGTTPEPFHDPEFMFICIPERYQQPSTFSINDGVHGRFHQQSNNVEVDGENYIVYRNTHATRTVADMTVSTF